MADTAPPPYEEKPSIPEEGESSTADVQHSSVPAVAPSIVYQQPAAQPTVILQQPAQPQFVTVTQPANVVIVHGIKEACDYESYQEFCPYCNQTVKTVVRYEWGTQTWIYCIISLIICWPLIFAICCECSKDAHHYCPCCQKLLAVKRR